jgi:hypothetical protein
MKTKVDEVYSEVKSRLKYNLRFTEDPTENLRILDRQVETTNITKCNLADLEKEYPGATTYLAYLLQSKNGIPFGICPDFKAWYNRKGLQARCRHNRGPVQVFCRGLLKLCPKREIAP